MVKNLNKLLEQALLHDGEMEEQIDDFISSMKKDKEEYIFAVTENSGRIAMILVEKTGKVFTNEQAWEKLKALWHVAYEKNMKAFIPLFAEGLKKGGLPLTGITIKKLA